MNIILTWIFWIVVLTFGGYIYNRIIYFVGAILWQFAENIIYYDRLWFNEGTTIKDVYMQIKYKDGIDHNGAYNQEYYYNDLYNGANMTKWIPGINIFVSTCCFTSYVIGFIFATILMIIKGIIIFCTKILYTYFLKYIIKVVKYIWNVLVKIYKSVRLNVLISKIKTFYHNIIFKLQNLRIA